MHSRKLLYCLCAAVLTDIRVVEDPCEGTKFVRLLLSVYKGPHLLCLPGDTNEIIDIPTSLTLLVYSPSCVLLRRCFGVETLFKLTYWLEKLEFLCGVLVLFC